MPFHFSRQTHGSHLIFRNQSHAYERCRNPNSNRARVIQDAGQQKIIAATFTRLQTDWYRLWVCDNKKRDEGDNKNWPSPHVCPYLILYIRIYRVRKTLGYFNNIYYLIIKSAISNIDKIRICLLKAKRVLSKTFNINKLLHYVAFIYLQNLMD